jgi:hypothetical protein
MKTTTQIIGPNMTIHLPALQQQNAPLLLLLPSLHILQLSKAISEHTLITLKTKKVISHSTLLCNPPWTTMIQMKNGKMVV